MNEENISELYGRLKGYIAGYSGYGSMPYNVHDVAYLFMQYGLRYAEMKPVLDALVIGHCSYWDFSKYTRRAFYMTKVRISSAERKIFSMTSNIGEFAM